MIVCIAEKPSVAREIAFVLGAKQRKDGYLEGNGYQVTWTFGHLFTLKEPRDYREEWKSWRRELLPMLPEKHETKMIKRNGIGKQFGVIKKLVRRASKVVNCGDAGQEGELIQRWVLQQAGCKAPVERLWISSLTRQAIQQGFRNLKPAQQFDRLYYAGQCRAIGDWLLGMNATRLYTLKYGGYKNTLSIGRVQTPTLSLLVERQQTIDNFKPEPYWELKTLYRGITFGCEEGRFMDKAKGETALAQVDGQPFEITKFEKKKGKEYCPPLYDLTALQVDCNKRYGFSADTTLKLAQSLYEKKLITYPRVDTRYLPSDMHSKVQGILQQMPVLQNYIAPLLGKPIAKSKRVFNDAKITDHHAIVPTGGKASRTMQEDKVYDRIARRFVAIFYPECKVSRTTVLGQAAEVPFKATGREVLDPGWRVLYSSDKATPDAKQPKGKDKAPEEPTLPTFTQGESGPHEPSLEEKVTQPPKSYTEATLLRAMETAGKTVDDDELRDLMKANGIGRPATRANIIETLFKRQYIRRERKTVVPTQKGMQLIDTIQNELLKSAELTGQWEKKLRDIEQGEQHPGAFVKELEQMVTTLIDEVSRLPDRQIAPEARGGKRGAGRGRMSKGQTLARPRPTKRGKAASSTPNTENTTPGVGIADCPKCRQGRILKGNSAYGCNRFREGCDFRFPFVYLGKKISEKQAVNLFTKGKTWELKNFIVNGEKQTGKLVLTRDAQVEFVSKTQAAPTRPAAKSERKLQAVISNRPTCPRCKQGVIIKGNTAYGCNRWREGCRLQLPYEAVRMRAAGKPITAGLVREMLEEVA